MDALLDIHVVTIFPSMLSGFLENSILARARRSGLVRVDTVDPRDFTTDRHRTADDRPYGGGPGMIMKPEPLFEAVESVRRSESQVILMSPQGRVFDQHAARRLSGFRHLVFVCGHYEGVDERVRRYLVDEDLSIGDYILTNGVLPAAVVMDCVTRLIPGVLGAGVEAAHAESFAGGALEYPQYTRPDVFRGYAVPEILKSGDHQAVARWRQEQALQRTRERRPDLLSNNAQDADPA